MFGYKIIENIEINNSSSLNEKKPWVMKPITLSQSLLTKGNLENLLKSFHLLKDQDKINGEIEILDEEKLKTYPSPLDNLKETGLFLFEMTKCSDFGSKSKRYQLYENKILKTPGWFYGETITLQCIEKLHFVIIDINEKQDKVDNSTLFKSATEEIVNESKDNINKLLSDDSDSDDLKSFEKEYFEQESRYYSKTSPLPILPQKPKRKKNVPSQYPSSFQERNDLVLQQIETDKNFNAAKSKYDSDGSIKSPNKNIKNSIDIREKLFLELKEAISKRNLSSI